MIVKIKKVSEDVNTPKYQTDGAAGFDFESTIDKLIMPGQVVVIPTGLRFEIPKGYELQVRPRSGMSLKTKFRISNSPGTIDADFRGEVGIIIENTDVKPQTINKGQRIAQGIFSKVERGDFTFVEELGETERAGGGWGSTGD